MGNPAHFEIFRDTKNQFRFRLRAPNGEIIGVSEAYTQKENCKKGIDAVKEYARYAGLQDLTLLIGQKPTDVEPVQEAPAQYTETYNGWVIIRVKLGPFHPPAMQHECIYIAYKNEHTILGIDIYDLKADIDEAER